MWYIFFSIGSLTGPSIGGLFIQFAPTTSFFLYNKWATFAPISYNIRKENS